MVIWYMYSAENASGGQSLPSYVIERWADGEVSDVNDGCMRRCWGIVALFLYSDPLLDYRVQSTDLTNRIGFLRTNLISIVVLEPVWFRSRLGSRQNVPDDPDQRQMIWATS